MPLEQMRDAQEAETSTYEQSILSKRMGRKRKAPQDDEVSHKKKLRSQKESEANSFCLSKIRFYRILKITA